MIPIHQTLDAAVLQPELSQDETREALLHCLRYSPATVCVRPCDIALAQSLCADTTTGVCVVLGFPHGDQLTASKADEARRYMDLGVSEIDMVANFGWARSGDWAGVEADIRAVVEIAKPSGIPVKVIFETCTLIEDEIRQLTAASIRAEADYVKTSTGFNGPGASEDALRIMLEAAQGKIAVKASGGIRDVDTARKYLEMGVTRLGVGYKALDALCGDVRQSYEGAY